MKKSYIRKSRESGFVMVYMAVGLTTLLLFSGLAVDSGRAYVVKSQLTQSGRRRGAGGRPQPQQRRSHGRSGKVFKANFPTGYHGHHDGDRSDDGADFFSSSGQRGRPASTP